MTELSQSESKLQTLPRRSFLKAAGFSFSASMIASCSRGPEEKLIPLLVRPEEQPTPGKSSWYATTCGGCKAGCGILTRNRDGRPIKIEGNPQHPVSQGGVCAVGQAAVLGLYDSKRLQEPMIAGQPTAWKDVDSNVAAHLETIDTGLYVLTGTITSPTTKALISRFVGRFQDSAHVEYDSVSYSAILDAHERSFGRRILPRYRFDRSRLVVSFAADFLGTWISPMEFTRDWARGRRPEGPPAKFLRHIQLEGHLTLTGSNADRRIPVSPAGLDSALTALARKLARKSGRELPPWKPAEAWTGVDDDTLDEIADELWAARGKSLVVCGSNDVSVQCVVNLINQMLGNYGKTVDIEYPSMQWNGSDQAMRDLVSAMLDGRVNALFVTGVNAAYCWPGFEDALKRVPLVVTLSEHLDETAELSTIVCPAHHFLESWDEAEVVSGLIGMSQPVMAPMGNTRSVRESLAAWMREPKRDLEILQSYWVGEIFPLRKKRNTTFQEFWDQAVHDGFVTIRRDSIAAGSLDVKTFDVKTIEPNGRRPPASGLYSLVLYQKVGMLDGQHALNPWLHELPDPITKSVWDNYACLAPAIAERLSVKEGDIVNVASGDAVIELPVLIQPGQHEHVVAIAVGYGRKGTDCFEKIGPEWIQGKPTVEEGHTVGSNAFILGVPGSRNHVSVTPTGKKASIARTQTYHTMTDPEILGGEQREIAKETTLAALNDDPPSENHHGNGDSQLWSEDHEYVGHHWGMTIDLNRCTGCSACVISCQAENNVPVVGKDEVSRRREMHWIRIDRYFSGDDRDLSVMHQPVMCQHCDNAPCETVCPVVATVHSSEGLNQQIYNRCIGTKYCANNCPYKVRRFNWFEYRQQAEREHLVLNPDVTTRMRGIMEKCTMCVQRIQEVKAEATESDVPMTDGSIQTACQQSCPAEAIVFGDMNDPSSRVSKLIENKRYYRLLEELNTKPSVGYLTRVRKLNKES